MKVHKGFYSMDTDFFFNLYFKPYVFLAFASVYL